MLLREITDADDRDDDTRRFVVWDSGSYDDAITSQKLTECVFDGIEDEATFAGWEGSDLPAIREFLMGHPDAPTFERI